MDLETILNVYMLFTAGAGLFLCLYRYVEAPKRVWVYSTFFFLAHFLSDYYWTVYILIMDDYPNTSALLAYFGWNAAYVFMTLLLRLLQREEERKFFHPAILIPIPINIAQFCLYYQYGGIINNIWQGVFCTAIACLSIQSLMYYLKNKKSDVPFPWFHLLSFIFVISQYGMWTSSCFTFENQYLDPYYYFSIVCFSLNILFALAAKRSYGNLGKEEDTKNSIGSGFQMVFQVAIALIICGCGVGGYLFAEWMKERLAPVMNAGASEEVYGSIASMLFDVSVVLVLIILGLMWSVYVYYKHCRDNARDQKKIKGKFNFLFTMSITFLLMVFAVLYTSRLLYQESVASLYGDCEEQVADIATSLSNYLDTDQAILWVTGDSVDEMWKNGVGIDKIHDYILVETERQTIKYDENITGFYGYIGGTYLDGLDWVPPEGYDPVQRDWYKYAIEAGGEVTVVPPYVDAQTGDVVISFCKMLSDGSSVMSLDVTLNHIQDIVSEINVDGKGYGMVVDRDGMVIAHYDREMNGQYCREIFGDEAFMTAVLKNSHGRSSVNLDGEKYTLFIDEVDDQWYTVILIKTEELLSDVHLRLIVNMCVYAIIFFLITFFYYMSYMNEQKASRIMEELNTEKQKQDYEARVLKLEKSAADDANKAKSRFLADMSHEIRTPINAVLGMNEMILRETDSDSIREYADNIRSSGKALLNLINSILDFSKIEDGKMEIVPVDYSTVDMVHYLQSSIEERAGAKNLAFIVDLDPAIPVMLHGDDMRVSQVIMNLLTNAVKYTKSGEVRLSVSEVERDTDTICLQVKVKDTGIGIRREDMPKLFESFERLDKEKNRNIEGTGLGMSIVTRLLSMMGSELSVESEYGVGSTFSFIIRQGIVNPKAIGDSYVQLNDGSRAESVKIYQESFRAPEGEILIVDDTKMNLKVVTNLLKKTLLKIDTVLSGEESIVLCEKKKYDVILMDQRMPGMDGTQALKLIRSREGGMNQKTPVICLTADAISGARDRYLAEGFSDYLTKPVDSHELEKMLLTYLPKDKIIMGETPSQSMSLEKTADAASERAGRLEACGINVKTAMVYCQNDEEIFETILADYVKEAPQKLEKLKDCYAQKDWKNYTVYVHSLKSTSKLIGATDLSEMAARLEAAAGESKEEAVTAEHEKLLDDYEKLFHSIQEIVDTYASDSSDKEDIMEFLPE